MTLPAHVHAGRTAFTLDNRGAEPHEVRFVCVWPRRTPSTISWRGRNRVRPFPTGSCPSGGIGSVAPGLTATTSPRSTPAILRGAVRYSVARRDAASGEGDVRARCRSIGRRVRGRAPEADLTVVLSDHHFLLSAPMPAGRPVVAHPEHRLRAASGAGREAAGRSRRIRPSADGSITEAAARVRAGRSAASIDVPPDGEAWFSAELTPGRYLLHVRGNRRRRTPLRPGHDLQVRQSNNACGGRGL